MNSDWSLKPIVRWGTVVDDDYNHVGSLASASLTSHYYKRWDNGFEFGMDNQVGVYRSVSGNVEGLNSAYDLNETVLRNSLRIGGPLEGTPLGSGARWQAWVTDTHFSGDDLFISNYQDVGVAVSTRVRAGRSFDEVLTFGVTDTYGEGGHNGIEFNLGYRF